MNAVIVALVCAVVGGVLLWRQEYRHKRDMRQAGAYWRAAMLHQCTRERRRR